MCNARRTSGEGKRRGEERRGEDAAEYASADRTFLPEKGNLHVCVTQFCRLSEQGKQLKLKPLKIGEKFQREDFQNLQ